MNLKLGNLYQGTWPHNHKDGIGLELVGVPNDIEKFYCVMASFSCIKVASARILADLMIDGVRKVTVMASLDFVALSKSFEELGIKMNIISPANHSTPKYFEASANWDFEIAQVLNESKTLDSILSDKTPIEKQIICERLENAKLAEALVGIKNNKMLGDFLYPLTSSSK